MRWYGLQPELPEKAVLRIRTAPNSTADVCGRVVKGQVLSVVSEAFELEQEDGLPPQTWLQVALPTADPDTTAQGFVMASLPDGMKLLVPWEQTGVRCCCYVAVAQAAVYEDASPATQPSAFIESREDTMHPYAILAVEGARAQVLHHEFGFVWVDRRELELVCTRLQHEDCSTPHSFFTLNEALPAEAQIAIRAFPSREAETVGLFNRSEVLEISTRCGDWLQIVGSGREQGDSWIMWRTDTLELLVEISGHHSEACERAFVNEVESVTTEEQMNESAMEDVPQNMDDEDAVEEMEVDSVRPIMPEEMVVNEDVDLRETIDSNPIGSSDENVDVSEATTHSGQAMDVAMAAGVEEDVDDSVHGNGEVLSDSTEDAADDQTGSASDLDEENPIVQDKEPAKLSWDDRPIQTTKQATFAWDEQPIGTSKNSTFNWDEQPVGASKKSAFHWDEQPVGSSKHAPNAWDEQPLNVKNHSDEWEESEQEPIEQDTSDALEVPETEHTVADISGDSKMASELVNNSSVVEVAEHNNEQNFISTSQPEGFDAMTSEEISGSLEPNIDATSEMEEDESFPETTSYAWDERPIQPQSQSDFSEFEDSALPVEETSSEAPNENPAPEERPCVDAENAFAAEAIETLSYIENDIAAMAEKNGGGLDDERMEIDNEAAFHETDIMHNADASTTSSFMDVPEDENCASSEEDLISDDLQEQTTQAHSDDHNGSSVQQYREVIAVTIRAPSPPSWDDRPIRSQRVSSYEDTLSAKQEEAQIDEGDMNSDSSWNDRPIRPAKSLHDGMSQDSEALRQESESEDTFESLTSQNRDSVLSDNSEVAILQDEGIMDSGDEDMPLQFDQRSFVDRRMQEPAFPTKHARYQYFEDVSKSKQQAREEDQVQVPKMDGISFIIRFGIAAYCSHRHSTTVMDDPFAQLLTDAVMLGRNPDAILQALVADEPPWDDWVVYTTPRIVLEATREDAQGIVDVLYARDNGVPTQLQIHSPTIERRKANMERSFKRMSIETTMPRNFNLIMHSTDADADAILEAEFGADEVSFDLVYPYKYPVLSGARTPKRSMSVYASSSISADVHQPIRRISRDIEQQPLPAPAQVELPASTQVELPAPTQAVSPAPAQVELPSPTQAHLPAATPTESPPVMPAMPDPSFTSPAPKSNPLKRAAAAIAKTPPVIPPKPVTTTSAVSATKTLKRSTSMVPPATRATGVKPAMPSPSPSTRSASSTPNVQRSSSMSLRPPSSIGGGLKTPSRLEAPTPSRRLTMAGGSLPTRSSLPSPKLTTKTTESLLQRRSLLQAPSPSKLPTPGSSTSSLPTTPSTTARSMSVSGTRMPEPSFAQSRRLTFGFGARPKSAIPTPRK